jgi:hypothetical protein
VRVTPSVEAGGGMVEVAAAVVVGSGALADAVCMGAPV